MYYDLVWSTLSGTARSALEAMMTTSQRELRYHIEGCSDVAELERWTRRAAVAESIAEVFA